MNPDPLTVEEFERVLNADRFATVEDLARTGSLRLLAEGARATEHPSDSEDDDTATRELPSLPTRRP